MVRIKNDREEGELSDDSCIDVDSVAVSLETSTGCWIRMMAKPPNLLAKTSPETSPPLQKDSEIRDQEHSTSALSPEHYLRDPVSPLDKQSENLSSSGEIDDHQEGTVVAQQPDREENETSKALECSQTESTQVVAREPETEPEDLDELELRLAALKSAIVKGNAEAVNVTSSTSTKTDIDQRCSIRPMRRNDRIPLKRPTYRDYGRKRKRRRRFPDYENAYRNGLTHPTSNKVDMYVNCKSASLGLRPFSDRNQTHISSRRWQRQERERILRYITFMLICFGSFGLAASSQRE
ncbi:unnamed protein product [Soboliphyme baturini]|uniref:Uncharacterized protein n=1 Tax=Soboliphyme baturini TaxID=241478 RepID=A0A183IJU3_9BILA|nr:unnamed protein product [Soboliphyme baturini]